MCVSVHMYTYSHIHIPTSVLALRIKPYNPNWSLSICLSVFLFWMCVCVCLYNIYIWHKAEQPTLVIEFFISICLSSFVFWMCACVCLYNVYKCLSTQTGGWISGVAWALTQAKTSSDIVYTWYKAEQPTLVAEFFISFCVSVYTTRIRSPTTCKMYPAQRHPYTSYWSLCRIPTCWSACICCIKVMMTSIMVWSPRTASKAVAIFQKNSFLLPFS